MFQNFHSSEETYSRWDRKRKSSLLESDDDLFRRRPKNHKTVWGFDFSDIEPLLSESTKYRYPFNWIGLQLKETGKLTSYFLDNHYFRNQKHEERKLWTNVCAELKNISFLVWHLFRQKIH